MADGDLLGILTSPDLEQFNQTIQLTDPYGMAGRSLAQWQPNYGTLDAAEGGITAFSKAFLSGLLQQYSRNNASEQVGKVVNLLPQLGSTPYTVATPEGVDPGAFGILRGSAILKNAQQQNVLDQRKETRINSLLQSILPEMVRGRQITTDQALGIATSDDPTKAILAAASKTPTADAGPTTAAESLNPLSSGKQGTSEKIKAYYVQFLESGMPPTQASAAARQQVEGEIKANNKSFDDAKAARSYGENLLQLANTARAGLSQAGQTGSDLASGYETLISTLSPILPGSQSEAKQQAAGDTLLNSIAPDIIKLARPIGGGATSDFEAKKYLGAGPSSSLTPEANVQLIEKLENLGKLNMEYADFLEAYRDANGGSTTGANAKWSQYKNAFPLFVGDGDVMQINSQRPSWQDYFAAVGSGEDPKQLVAPPISQGVKPSQAALQAEARALASSGKSQAEIAAMLRSKYGG